MDELNGRAAVVTGAANGIGRAIAVALVGAGVRVLMTDRDAGGIDVAAREACASGGVAEALEVDVCDPLALERVAEHAVKRFGALHIAVNNAGIVNGGPIWELSLEEWREVLDVNLWGVIHGVRAFVPRILEADEGHVVNVASMAAVVPHAGVGPYTVSKYGVLGLTEVLSAELEAAGSRVGASVVLPGMIRTGMNPVGSHDPSVVAAKVVDAIRRRRPYVFTDDYANDAFESRFATILAAHREVISKDDQEVTS